MDEQLKQNLLALLPRIRRFAYGLSGSRAAGDDLVQQTYERAIRSIDSFTPGTRLDSWMFRIAHNLHLNALRAAQVRGKLLDIEHLDRHRHVDGMQLAEDRLTLAAVRRAFDKLPEEQRVVLLLVCIEGLSYRETAELLKIPLGTVTSRLSRGRDTLKLSLEKEGVTQ